VLPGAIILLFLVAWPALREIWTGVIPSYRRYGREKRRLELLKLYFEVEAIRKDHELSELQPISSDTLSELIHTTRTGPNVSDGATRPYGKELTAISRSRQFAFGALGGVVVFLLSTLLTPGLYQIQFGGALTGPYLLGVVVRAMILIQVGGVAAWATNSKTPLDAFIAAC
jgi:hypothetical protein